MNIKDDQNQTCIFPHSDVYTRAFENIQIIGRTPDLRLCRKGKNLLNNICEVCSTILTGLSIDTFPFSKVYCESDCSFELKPIEVAYNKIGTLFTKTSQFDFNSSEKYLIPQFSFEDDDMIILNDTSTEYFKTHVFDPMKKYINLNQKKSIFTTSFSDPFVTALKNFLAILYVYSNYIHFKGNSQTIPTKWEKEITKANAFLKDFLPSTTITAVINDRVTKNSRYKYNENEVRCSPNVNVSDGRILHSILAKEFVITKHDDVTNCNNTSNSDIIYKTPVIVDTTCQLNNVFDGKYYILRY